MSLHTAPWPAGVPCWSDLSVADVAAARRFYEAVVGWSFEDTGEEYGGYVLAQARGAAAAGIGPKQHDGGAAWTLYIASDDADATAAAITQHGGQVVLAPGDVGPLGRMCLATDPTGAMFGVWQAAAHIGAGIVNEPGGLTWEDLRSTDPQRAWEFYGAVFGYRTQELEMVGSDYRLFSLAGSDAPLGGMGGMFTGETPESHWLVYFSVGDADRASEAAERAGGTVNQSPFDSPFGRMAGLADPEGAVFWVHQARPDRQETEG